jgi:ABC-type antimicrobial peptide transport system permease subunit
MVVGRALTLALVGLAIGIPAAAAMTRALSSVLLGVIQMDAPIFVGFAVLLAMVATLAAYIPARRAMRIDPMVALRHE